MLATCLPSANRLTVIDAGRLPSWLLASSHVLVPLTSVVAGADFLLIISLKASLLSLKSAGVTFIGSLDMSYPSGACISLIV